MMKWLVTDNKTPSDMPTRWNIEVPVVADGRALLIASENTERVVVTLDSGQLKAAIAFDAYPDAPVRLHGPAAAGDTVLICNTENRIALYINGQLQDEDWPLGRADLSGATCLTGSSPVMIHDDFAFDSNYRIAGKEETVHDIHNWLPPGHNTGIGDCMPFAHDGCYRLFYLFDRRHHQSKWNLGAHQWAQIVTRDFQTWRTCPLAITIDQQNEGSICTGSLIFRQNQYYAFFAIRMSDHSPARLTYAISENGVHFKKSNRFIYLKEPYEPVSARDPKVFLGTDSHYHMLVTTSLNGKGCLAHLVSDDLENWSQQGPFLALDIENQPECPDYFYYGGYYYLVYSIGGIARYYVSCNPFGPWQAPPDNQVGHDQLRVPKAAILNDRLIFAGFVAKDGRYGGHFSLHEAFSQSDGRLRFSPLQASAPGSGD